MVNDLKGLKVKKVIDDIDDLIEAAGTFSRGKTHVGENTIKGNIDEVFEHITKDAQPTKPGSKAFQLPDGRIVHKHVSASTGERTISINKAGDRLKKIRLDE